MQVCMYVSICSWMDVVTAGESLEYLLRRVVQSDVYFVLINVWVAHSTTAVRINNPLDKTAID